MAITARLVFLILAGVTFGLGAANVPSRVNLTNLGLLFGVIAVIFS